MGDWNGDGRGDVITRQTAGDTLVLHRGPGQRHLRRRRGDEQRAGRPFTGLAAVGDVTGDGHPDLVGQDGHGADDDLPGQRQDRVPGAASPRRPRMRTFNQIGSGSWQPRRRRARRSPAPTGPSCRSWAPAREHLGRLRLGRRSRRRRRRRPGRPGRPGQSRDPVAAARARRSRLRRHVVSSASGFGGLQARRLSSATQLGRGPLVLATSGPRAVPRVAQEHQRAPGGPAAPRNAGTPSSAAGCRSVSRRTPGAPLARVAAPRAGRPGSRVAAAGQPGDRVRAWPAATATNTSLCPGHSSAVVEHARPAAARRTGPRTGSSEQASDLVGAVVRLERVGPADDDVVRRPRDRVVTASPALQAAPRNTGTSQCGGRSSSTVSPGVEPELVGEQVRGLADPVGVGRHRQLGALTGGVVVRRDEGLARVAAQPCGQELGEGAGGCSSAPR